MDKITINSFDEYKNILQNLDIKDITKDDYEIFLENKRFFNEIKQKAQENEFKLSEMDYSNATFINKNQAYFVKLYDDRTYPAISNLFKDIKPLNDGDIWFGFRNFARNEFDLALLSVDNKGIAEYNKIHAEFVGNLKDILQKQGYDSIIFNDFQVSVFNPNQIKSIDNAGSWTDSAGKITKEKPSDESARHSYFNAQSPNILYSNEIWGGGLAGGTLNGLETDEDGNIIGFDPAKFVAGFIAGATGTKAVKSLFENPKFKASAQKFATIQRIKAKRENTMKYNTFKKIDESQKYGSKMKLIGVENLNADIIAYALSKNKRFAVNKLDEQTAKALNFKYPNDVRRTIQPDEVIHTLKRHGENSNLVKFSGQKPVTLDDIAKYQHYADNAKDKGLSFDKQGNEILVSFKRLDNDFYVVVEQIRKSQNELGFKDLYFSTGEFDESKLGKKISLPASS